LRILLDTHALLWWLLDSRHLSRQARVLIGAPEKTVFVSDEKLAAESFESLPLTAAQARQVALLPWHHRDPFDRMLIAQARTEGLTLLTADDVVTAYGGFVRLVR